MTDDLVKRLNALAWRREQEGNYTDQSLCMAAIEAIEALQARVAKLAKAIEVKHDEAERRIAALEADNARLRETLKPFAHESRAWDDLLPDNTSFWVALGPDEQPEPTAFILGDLRAAHKALETTDGQ